MRIARIVIRGAVALALAAFSPAARALDVELISPTAGPAYQDGALTDYFLSFTVEGSDIAGGTVFKPGLPPTQLCQLAFAGPGFLGAESWSCELEGFTSLDDICQQVGFGDFLYEILAAVGADDSVTLPFDPGCTDSFSGHPEITSPGPGATVPPIPGPSDFCWTCSVSSTCGPGNYVPAIVDPSMGDLASELFRDLAVPACWELGICIPPIGANYLFEVSALDFFADFVDEQTDLGDPFTYVSAFESFNFTTFLVKEAPPPTPPGVPGGEGVTDPVSAAKVTPGGSTLDVFWDPESCCNAADHHLVWGMSADLPETLGGIYTLGGSECLIGTTGSFNWEVVPSPALQDFLWWLVLANDAGMPDTTEGSWGSDSTGSERTGPGPGGVSSQCNMTTKDLTNTCGQ